jgi:hypothetical protein
MMLETVYSFIVLLLPTIACFIVGGCIAFLYTIRGKSILLHVAYMISFHYEFVSLIV